MRTSDLIRFFKKLLLLLPIPVLIFFLNYHFDPGKFWKGEEYEQALAQQLLHGENLFNVGNYNAVRLHKFYVEGLTHKNDIIILGSSRSMGISSRLFPGYTFFNHSVPASCLENYLGIYGMYRKKGYFPRYAIIEVSPWILHDNNYQNQWRSAEEEYKEIEKLTRQYSSYKPESYGVFQKYGEALSFPYFQVTFKYLLTHLGRGREAKLAQPINPNGTHILADGSWFFHVDDHPEQVRILAVNNAKFPLPGMDNFYRIDVNAQHKLEGFVKLLLHDGVKVVLYLPPYHPLMYKTLLDSGGYRVIQQVQEYVARFASANKILVIGSYVPTQCPINEEDFYDGIHLKPVGVLKMFNGTVKNHILYQ